MTDNAAYLMELAKKKFLEPFKTEAALSDSEITLFQSSANGEVAKYEAHNDRQDKLEQSKHREENYVLKADRIAWLCTDKEVLKLLTNKGLQLDGAKIDGTLDLRFVTPDIPLTFTRCIFNDSILLEQAKVKALSFEGTHVESINAESIEVDGSVCLNKGFKASGEVRFLGSKINGSLECDNGHFLNPNGIALNVDRANISGYVYLIDEFEAKGEVNLLNAVIGASFQCDGGQFHNQKENQKSEDNSGKALVADGMSVKGFVSLGNMTNKKPFNAMGEVRLVGATIGDSFNCNGGEFGNQFGTALDASGITVGGTVFLGGQFTSNSRIRLVGANISGALDLLEMTGCSAGEIYLQSANADLILFNNAFVLPQDNHAPTIRLTELTYKNINVYERDDDGFRPKIPNGKALLALLRHSIKKSQDPKVSFSLQPYEQAARVLRMNGYKRAATQVLVGGREDLLSYGDLKLWTKAWNHLLGIVIDYGYRPHKALVVVLIFVILGSFLFGRGFSGGLFLRARRYPDMNDYPPFNNIVYSIDTFVPIVDLSQKNYWFPNANAGRETTIPFLGIRKTWGRLLRYYFWVHTSLGWILSVLWVASLSNLVRKD